MTVNIVVTDHNPHWTDREEQTCARADLRLPSSCTYRGYVKNQSFILSDILIDNKDTGNLVLLITFDG